MIFIIFLIGVCDKITTEIVPYRAFIVSQMRQFIFVSKKIIAAINNLLFNISVKKKYLYISAKKIEN